MPDEEAFSAVTLLVAACEHAVAELEGLQPRPWRLLERIRNTHEEAVEVALRLAPRDVAAD